jgi:hypothetical protein
MSEEKGLREPSLQQSKSCFVIMPISDADGYDPGHFDRVYKYLIKPACEKAGFTANRANQSSKANYIVIDILRQIINSDMAICDLSSRNSNVFFELGLRQAFNLKTVLIKDSKTPRSFDISGLRCIDYDEKLRVDNVELIVDKIADSLKETKESREDEVNSLIQLLAVDAAKLPEKVKLSDDTGIILSEIKRLRDDFLLPSKVTYINPSPAILGDKISPLRIKLPNGEISEHYSKLYLKEENLPFNSDYGDIVEKRDNYTVVKRGNKFITINDDNPIWAKLTIKDSNF